MNNARYRAIERGLESVVKKVLDIMPSDSEVRLKDIISSTSMSHDQALRSLRTLVDSGLAREPSPGVFLRIVPREPIKATPKPELSVVHPQPVLGETTNSEEAPDKTPRREIMDRIAEVGSRLRSFAEDASNLARLVDDIALDIADRISRIEAETQKMRQLQTLLKSLSVGE